MYEQSATAPLDSERFGVYLADALGATLSLADGTGAPPALTERLSAAAGYLLQRDPHLRRIGRTAAFNALAVFGSMVPSEGPLVSAWLSLVRDRLHPVGETVVAVLRETARLDRATLNRIEETLLDLVLQGYSRAPAGLLWECCEAAARIVHLRRELDAARMTAGPGESVQANALKALDRHRDQLCDFIMKFITNGDDKPPTPPPGWWRHTATRQEALGDGLLNPAAQALTSAIYGDGFLAEHIAAIREQVGEPVAVPIVVLANDRWFREMHPDRQLALGVHIRNEAILLSRGTGGRALEEKGQGRLSHTLVHELVHATQRDRRARRSPPYDERAAVVEVKILEGLTEYFTMRVLSTAQGRWDGDGKNPYSDREFLDSAYYGYSFVCIAGVQVSGGVAETFLREMSHNPHKLTMYVELLVGSYTAERKQAIVPVFERLFALAEAWASEPRRLEVELTEVAQMDFRAYSAEWRS